MPRETMKVPHALEGGCAPGAIPAYRHRPTHARMLARRRACQRTPYCQGVLFENSSDFKRVYVRGG